MVKLIYKDIAVGSAEAAQVTTTTAVNSTPALVPYGAQNSEKYITLEHNVFALDGTRKHYDGGAVSFWSGVRSKSTTIFTSKPKVTMTFSQNFTSVGIYITFRDSWATSIDVEWYRGSTLLDSGTFYPTGKTYFVNNAVEAYNKLVITFNKSAMPYQRIMLDSILLGIVREFERGDLRSGSARITQEIDNTSREMAINELSFTLSSHDDIAYMFQLKQPIEAYDGNTLVGVFYISESDRKSASVYDVSCIDAIGVLDDEMFSDAVYSNKNALLLAQEICSPFTVEMDAALQSQAITGVLVGKTKREALQQLCFRLGAVADTSGTNKIRIFSLPTTAAEIPAERIRTGATVKTDSLTTLVRVVAHNYSTSGSGESVVVNGVTYYDTQTVYEVANPLVTSADKQNVVDVADATLVSPNVGQTVAQRLYNEVSKRETHKLKFRVVGERVGDYVQTVSPWDTEIAGTYVKGNILLSGLTLSDAEIIGSEVTE